jgi:hypothetical protein
MMVGVVVALKASVPNNLTREADGKLTRMPSFSRLSFINRHRLRFSESCTGSGDDFHFLHSERVIKLANEQRLGESALEEQHRADCYARRDTSDCFEHIIELVV